MREFSEESRKHFYDIIDEVNDSQWSVLTDLFGDRLIELYERFGYLNLVDYLDDMESYWTKVFDKNNTEKDEIDRIFKAVEAVDEKYEGDFNKEIEGVTLQLDLLKKLSEIMYPGKGNFRKSQICKVKDEGLTVISSETLKSMLRTCKWKEELITDDLIEEMQAYLIKYQIDTREQIKMFVAQISYETMYGSRLTEMGSDKYFSTKKYGKKYRGTGYVHLTFKYGYQAFAIYEVINKYPEIGEEIRYPNPNNNNAKTIDSRYEQMLSLCQEKGIDIKEYTDIVDIGADYVAEHFAWETAGYFWQIGNIGEIIDQGGTIDDVTAVINKWTDSYEARRKLYESLDEFSY